MNRPAPNRPDGIRVSAICPGAIETDIVGPDGFASMDRQGLERMKPFMMLSAQSAQPQSVANAALFLASDAADYVSGAIVPVDMAWGAA